MAVSRYLLDPSFATPGTAPWPQEHDRADTGTLDSLRLRSLWSAVIQRAWDDVFGTSDAKAGIERSDAMRFLLDVRTTSPWREQRELICTLAGIDPSALEEAARIKVRRLAADIAIST
jgi:hypothetical protein